MNKIEHELLISILNGEVDDLMESFSILIPNLEELLQSEKVRDYTENDLMFFLYEEIARKMEKTEIADLKMNKYLAFGIIKESILHNSLLNQEGIENLIDSMNSVDVIDKLLNDDALKLEPELREQLVTKRNNLRTHDIYDKDGNAIGIIKFSDEEIRAIKAYIGDDVGYSFYPKTDTTYMLINTYLRGGRVLGEASAGWNYKEAVKAIINNPEEFMEFVLNLANALHKYGKTIKEPISVSRSEMNGDDNQQNQTNIFYSTTKGKEESTIFKSRIKDTVRTYVKNGIDAIDIADVLKDDYSKPEEKEILIAPFIHFKRNGVSTRIEKFEADAVVKYHEKVVKTYEIDLEVDSISKPLTEDEREDYSRYMQIFLDPELRAKCAEIWQQSDQISAGVEPYLKWREAFSKVFAYRQRENALALDREIESQIRDIKSEDEATISIRDLTKNALNSGVRTGTVQEADEQMNKSRIETREKEGVSLDE